MRFQRQTISVEEAVGRLLTDLGRLEEEQVDIYESYGRILARDITATSDLPPFDRSPLDGFAVRAEDTAGATVEQPVPLQVVETIAAGDVPAKEVTPGTASRIMTGAMLPPGANAVIMFEQTEQPGEMSREVRIKRQLAPGENLSRQGEEMQQGSVVAKAGERINAGTLAILATFGYARVPVVRKPRVGLLSTGTELLEVDEPLVPGKIRNSNAIMLSAMIAETGGIPVLFEGLPDELPLAKKRIGECLEQVDLLVTSGGVSVGDYDVMAYLTDEPDVSLLFNRVAIRPGSPTTALLYQNKLICALSGNPGACFLGAHLFLLPVLRSLLGEGKVQTKRIKAFLGETYDKPCPYPRYLRGKLTEEKGSLYVWPDWNDKAGNLCTMSKSECFAIIPPGGRGKLAGEVVEVICHVMPGWSREE
ncbi:MULTISPECIES: molybdopterin molybdotransferase MoeA [Brevibacillus]|jgi:molybdopterin molybdotransferase|uniref:Molybdopterin molybdenumtransferase n=1 Tax=Brevibacillus borstelensis AK1 TaxID=1300222 RepID=M8ECQ4_9BACL|nr:gephyrin-like molybdotransferase Glp [Brevibacillus borstelensis]EMT53280.1 molybdopterin biosynthesis protein MoeA [Brevibacillus borstelensis AK1]MED1744029.1 molybdopterin molybdotransferase MoeA [Brevibacillus borstelensis]MED1885776.1 molybdopterin molybdotransferase MoeA [Brevibacillus borstelensis]RNB62544.1 molybdopterin molybdenumtransferase MoeA [Brevibacillus borstelensis]GED54954.1 molybdopterin molybdenumtransferase MoeA [Brevibacillus borstelensis]